MSNDFAEIEQKIKEKKAAEIISHLRAGMLVNKTSICLFSNACLRLKPVARWSIATMAVDGTHLFYNPDFTIALTKEHGFAILVHEVMHIANYHHLRRGGRPVDRWNIACDLAINDIIRDAGLKPPEWLLYPGEGRYASFPKGLSAEEYDRLLVEQEKNDPQCSSGDSNPYGIGGVMDAPGTSDVESSIAELEADAVCVAIGKAIEAADADKADPKGGTFRGNIPQGLRRFVNQPKPEKKVPWRELLREYLTKQFSQSKTWRRGTPPRLLFTGITLPRRSIEPIGTLAIAIDCSGSITEELLAQFSSEIQDICENCNVNVKVYYHDTHVAHTTEWAIGEGPLVIEPHGGGGTSHIHVLRDMQNDQIGDAAVPPIAMVCMTDMYSEFPSESEVEIPTIWAVFGDWTGSPPFGELVKVENE